ncbi:MAG: SDR family NAD(P)-dependent oxidoreductase [Calditrichaceae bacterium]|nr:SDR family NAD(P)-dependent oxidoreductase [Calditrichaceae bacterium]MBN2708577.1 SDR family NAD(P)-dependent oxidoreductase [Calditrichaceae bacterium]RQV96886.1 MAG: SDR family NAD(P)-dependent oxidoreductase [Calditrichota bacterium]
MQQALMIGNSDGIGLAATKRLLTGEWNVVGISRSESAVRHPRYTHYMADVGDGSYAELLDKLLLKYSFDLCIYFVGIGELLNLQNMRDEPKIIDVNLTAMVKTAAAIIPTMVEKGKGHFIGLSSVADDLLSAEAPSYHASKAGFTNYLGGLALALKSKGVFVTNIRFGFVDTKMAKADIKPFLMSVEKAVDHIQICMKKKPVRYTAPRIVIPLVKFRKLMMRLSGR